MSVQQQQQRRPIIIIIIIIIIMFLCLASYFAEVDAYKYLSNDPTW